MSREGIRGKKLTGIIPRISSHHIPVSFPMGRIHLLDMLHKMIKKDGVHASLGSLIVDAVELTYGSTNLSDIENLLVLDYARNRGQKYENFSDLIEDCVSKVGVKGLAEEWGLKDDQVARLLYNYCRRK